MEKKKIIYWTTTGIVGGMSLLNAFSIFTNPKMTESLKNLGYPKYFGIELGIATVIGAIVLLTPQIPARFKEWAYVGFGITFISAIIAHGTVDGAGLTIFPLIFLLLLTVSYIYFHKVKNATV